MKITLSILLAATILGGFYYVAEVNKQRSIERQQQTQLDTKADADKRVETLIDSCVLGVQLDYVRQSEGVPKWSPLGVELAKKLKNDEDTCINKYK